MHNGERQGLPSLPIPSLQWTVWPPGRRMRATGMYGARGGTLVRDERKKHEVKGGRQHDYSLTMRGGDPSPTCGCAWRRRTGMGALHGPLD